MPEMTPRAFSFNSPHGACPECQGLGAVYDFDPGAARARRIAVARRTARSRRGRRATGSWSRKRWRRSAKFFGIDLGDAVPPAAEEAARPAVLRRGSARRRRAAKKKSKAASAIRSAPASKGSCPNLRRRYEEGSWVEQESLEPYRALRPCPTCQGERLKPQSRAVRVKGRTIDGVRGPADRARR